MFPGIHQSVVASLFVASMLITLPVNALSRRAQQQYVQLQERMSKAEDTYRRALVGVQNGQPQAMAAADKALEDMEDVIIACANLRHCPMGTLLTSYKRLLKTQVDALESDDNEQAPKVDDLHIDLAKAQGAVESDNPNLRLVSLTAEQGSPASFTVIYNDAVQIGIRRWLTELRPQLLMSYENYINLRAVMWPEWQRRGLPESLLFGIIAKESSGRAHINSRAGAVGLMQFMPATGRRYGLGYDETGFDRRLDAQRVAAASAEFLSERLAEFKGNIELSLAGYNGGEGRASRVFSQYGGSSFWHAPVYAQFPAETQDYVPMVIAAALLFLHPDQYGVDFPEVNSQPAELALARPTSLYELAVCLGNKGTRDGYFRVLRNLNPRQEPDRWLPAGTHLYANQRMFRLYRRFCIAGPRAQMAHALASANINSSVIGRMTSTEVRTYSPMWSDRSVTARAKSSQSDQRSGHRRPSLLTVAEGQSLQHIAQRHHCQMKRLIRVNHLVPPFYRIHPGQTIKLDGCLR